MSYDSWSKEKLISKIRKLEEALGKSKPAPTAAPSLSDPVASATTAPVAKKKKKEFDFSKFSTRKIAIRFAYLGWNYSGLAVQNDPAIPTVEGHILAALFKTKLVPSIEPGDCDFSRCGRTDKGVSAFRQVISLRVRSQLTPEEQQNPENDSKEIDYLHMLNQLIPDDVRLYEICLRPGEDFDARFSCQFRHYKYFFHNSSSNPSGLLDIDKMNEGAKLFLGENDFRNFCKVDGSKQITSFRREILSSAIIPVDLEQNLYCFDLKGTAFLWHQVRSMVAILFLVGHGLEEPQIIQKMMDPELMPRRPTYEMAADIPLVLYDCGFPDLEWKSFRLGNSVTRLQDRTYTLWHEHWMRNTMASAMLKVVNQSIHPPYGENDQNKIHEQRVVVDLGNGKGRTLTKYVPLENRDTLEPPEVVNARWLERKGKEKGVK